MTAAGCSATLVSCLNVTEYSLHRQGISGLLLLTAVPTNDSCKILAHCARLLARATCGTQCVVTFPASRGGIHVGKKCDLKKDI